MRRRRPKVGFKRRFVMRRAHLSILKISFHYSVLKIYKESKKACEACTRVLYEALNLSIVGFSFWSDGVFGSAGDDAVRI
jgi:hypothetical protein